MSNIQSDIPLVNVPFVGKNGMITEAWLLFLVQLFRRTGGGTGVQSLTVANVLSYEETFGITSGDSPFSGEISISSVVPPVSDGFSLEMQPTFIPTGMDGFSIEETFSPTLVNNALSEMTMAPSLQDGGVQSTSSITVGASPFTYTATYRQAVHVVGGTVSVLAYGRGATSLLLGVVAAGEIVEMNAGDTLKATYTLTPTMTLIPR